MQARCRLPGLMFFQESELSSWAIDSTTFRLRRLPTVSVIIMGDSIMVLLECLVVVSCITIKTCCEGRRLPIVQIHAIDMMLL